MTDRSWTDFMRTKIGARAAVATCLSLVALACSPHPPRAAPQEISIVQQAGAVAAGRIVSTPCFDVRVPVPSYALQIGCHVTLSTETLGAAAGPDVPYIQVTLLNDTAGSAGATLAQRTDHLLGEIRKMNAAPQGGPAGIDRRASKGPFDTLDGAFQGVSPSSVDGHPANRISWGFSNRTPNLTVCEASRKGTQCSHAVTSEFTRLLVLVPPGLFTSQGQSLETLMISGHDQGYQSQAYRAAMDGVHLKF